MNPTAWMWVHFQKSHFGFDIEDGVIVTAPPEAKWAIGEEAYGVMEFYEKNGGEVAFGEIAYVYRITTPKRVFAIRAVNGRVASAAPCAKWANRRKLSDVFAYYKYLYGARNLEVIYKREDDILVDWLPL